MKGPISQRYSGVENERKEKKQNIQLLNFQRTESIAREKTSYMWNIIQYLQCSSQRFHWFVLIDMLFRKHTLTHTHKKRGEIRRNSGFPKWSRRFNIVQLILPLGSPFQLSSFVSMNRSGRVASRIIVHNIACTQRGAKFRVQGKLNSIGYTVTRQCFPFVQRRGWIN